MGRVTASSTDGWLTVETIGFRFETNDPPETRISIGSRNLIGRVRRRKAGSYVDNTLAGRREIYIVDGDQELGWIDTGRLQFSDWPDRDDADHRGISGTAAGVAFFIGKPATPNLLPQHRLAFVMGGQPYVVNLRGWLCAGDTAVGRLSGYPPLLRPDTDEATKVVMGPLTLAGATELLYGGWFTVGFAVVVSAITSAVGG